ncbi:MAG: ZIP family metal transporter [Clostridia bacterium]|nr:ZIP family metal transporter [Clostridia bacterium]
MFYEILKGIFIPLLGTTIGSAFVFFIKPSIKENLIRIFSGFAAGVMVAASIWSLLLPALSLSENWGSLAFVPPALGFLLGTVALILTDRYIPLEKLFRQCGSHKHKTAILVLAVTAHNLPEGIAVGAVYAALLSGDTTVSIASAFALALGIGIQNLPEGAIISMPLYAAGTKRPKAFLIGALSGAVEPIGAILALCLAKYLAVLPFLLSFAAGTMIYVVVEELIPSLKEKETSISGILIFTLGFLLMMILDVALG